MITSVKFISCNVCSLTLPKTPTTRGEKSYAASTVVRSRSARGHAVLGSYSRRQRGWRASRRRQLLSFLNVGYDSWQLLPVGQPTDHPRPGGSGPPACAPCRSCTGHGTAWRTAATGSARPPVVASTGRMRAAGRRLRPLLLPPSPPPPSPVVPPPPPPSRQWQLTLIPHPSPLVEVAARRERRRSTGEPDGDELWSQPHLLFTKNSIRRFVRSARAMFCPEGRKTAEQSCTAACGMGAMGTAWRKSTRSPALRVPVLLTGLGQAARALRQPSGASTPSESTAPDLDWRSVPAATRSRKRPRESKIGLREASAMPSARRIPRARAASAARMAPDVRRYVVVQRRPQVDDPAPDYM